jgi:circadian clock protein KaiC
MSTLIFQGLDKGSQDLSPPVFGLEALDRLYGAALKPGTLLVIMGHPGSGKTTLASTMCVTNALRGWNCLYVSLQEDKEKLFAYSKGMGLDMYEAERRGLLKFVKLPATMSVESLEGMLDLISRTSLESGSRVIVIDSVNVMLLGVRDDNRKRALLQNFFTELPMALNGVVVLVEEVRPRRDEAYLSPIEFAADIVLLLRHEISRGLISRYLEVRKVRGSRISVARMPFIIRQGRGIEVMVPPHLEDIPAEKDKISLPCPELEGALGPLRRGTIIYVSYPADARENVYYTGIVGGIVVANRLRSLVVSFKIPVQQAMDYFASALKAMGGPEDLLEEASKYFKFYSLNPFSYSTPELVSLIYDLATAERYDAVMIHEVGLLPFSSGDHRELAAMMYNLVNGLKARGITVLMTGSRIDERTHRLYSSIADAVVSINVNVGRRVETLIYAWSRGNKPVILSEEAIINCMHNQPLASRSDGPR